MERTESRRSWQTVASCFLALTLAPFAASNAQEPEAASYVRVPKSANVHAGPTTARPVLVVVAKDTVLQVVGSRGEWLEVELVPKLKETGIVMRWYENEDRGFVHESTVEVVDEKPDPK
ncbi:MAG TPA: SH3 domain-containing protein [Vicinamibacteria bacterium]|nr:SH3 domain-containing protein [Vicinamibacteria bacterium]